MRNRKELILSLAVVFILNILLIMLVQRELSAAALPRESLSVASLLTTGRL